MERGDGVASGLGARKKVNLLFHTGAEPIPAIPDVRLHPQPGGEPTDKKALEFLLAREILGRPFLAPPALPPDRAAALRAAFAATLRDPEFLKDAERSKLETDLVTAEEVDAVLKRGRGRAGRRDQPGQTGARSQVASGVAVATKALRGYGHAVWSLRADSHGDGRLAGSRPRRSPKPWRRFRTAALDAQFELGVDLLQAADRVGFDLVLFAERHLGNDLSAWVLASAIGSRLNHIRALVAVHPGLWDPVMVGKLAVSLDRVCRGRMALNIVNGWFDEEFRMFGGTVLQGEERYRRTIEFIDILRGLWTNEKFSYAGQFYKVDNGQLLLKPASPAPPEIYSVSRSDRGRDFIAEHCDWWFVDYPKTAETTDDVLRGIEESVADMNRRTDQARPQGALRAQSVRRLGKQ